MEPFSKDDPLYDLLGKARHVEPRSNFTQNVMRAIRQEPQAEAGFWSSLTRWLEPFTLRPAAYTGAAALVALSLFLAFNLTQNPVTEDVTPRSVVHVSVPDADSTPVDGVTPSVPEAGTELQADTAVASELDNVDQLSVLLAQGDTSALTDSEIALLLY